MNTSVVVLVLTFVATFVATSYLLWKLGLFDDLPRLPRFTLISVCAGAYMGAQLAPIAAGLYFDEWYPWLARAFTDGAAWSFLLVIGCITSALRLLTFRRGPSRHRSAYAWLSWILVVALTATAAKVTFGIKPPPGPIEALAVAVLAWRLAAHRGNLAHLMRSDFARLAAWYTRSRAAVSRFVRSASR